MLILCFGNFVIPFREYSGTLLVRAMNEAAVMGISSWPGTSSAKVRSVEDVRLERKTRMSLHVKAH